MSLNQSIITPKIAIIDDEIEIVDILKNIINRKFPHIETLCFEKPEEALKEIALKQIRIVITDINMPKIEGDEVLSACMKLSQGTRVILISAHTSVIKVINCFNLGASAFIYKPFEITEVVQTVQMCLDQITYWNNIIGSTAVSRQKNAA